MSNHKPLESQLKTNQKDTNLNTTVHCMYQHISLQAQHLKKYKLMNIKHN